MRKLESEAKLVPNAETNWHSKKGVRNVMGVGIVCVVEVLRNESIIQKHYYC